MDLFLCLYILDIITTMPNYILITSTLHLNHILITS